MNSKPMYTVQEI